MKLLIISFGSLVAIAQATIVAHQYNVLNLRHNGSPVRYYDAGNGSVFTNADTGETVAKDASLFEFIEDWQVA